MGNGVSNYVSTENMCDLLIIETLFFPLDVRDVTFQGKLSIPGGRQDTDLSVCQSQIYLDSLTGSEML